MSDFEIGVDFSDINEVLAALKGLEAQFVKTTSSIIAQENRLKQASKASADTLKVSYFKTLEDAEKKYEAQWIASTNRRMQLMENSKRLEEREAAQKVARMLKVQREEEKLNREREREAQKLAAENKYLEQRYNHLASAARFYALEQERISTALERGIIDLNQHAAAVRQLDFEYEKLQQGVYLAGSKFNFLGQSAEFGSKSASRVGLVAQQAGYQVADFAVQVQGGTNALVALGQQGSQLLAMFGPWGAIAGAALAIGTSIALPFVLARDRVEELQSTIQDLEMMSNVFDSLGDSITTGLIDKMDLARNRFGEFMADVISSQRDDLANALKDSLSGSTESLQPENQFDFWSLLGAGAGGGAVPFNPNLFESFEESQAQLELINAEVDKFLGAEWSSPREAAEAFSEMYDRIKSIEGVSQEVLDSILGIGRDFGVATELDSIIEQDRQKLEEFVNNIRESIVEAEEDIAEKTAENADAALEALVEYVNWQKQAAADAAMASIEKSRYISEETQAMIDQLSIASLIRQYGEESTQVLNERLNVELRIYSEQLKQQGVTGQTLTTMVEIKRQVILAQQEEQRLNNLARDLLSTVSSIAGVDISGVFNNAIPAVNNLLGKVRQVITLMSQIGSIGMSNEALAAENAALAAGASPGMARVEGQVTEFTQNSAFDIPVVGNVLSGIAGNIYRGRLQEGVRLQEQNSALIESYNDSLDTGDGGGRGSGGGGTNEVRSILEEITKEMEQRKRLSEVMGRERDLMENIIEIENRLGDQRQNVSDEQIRALAEQQLALEEFDKALEEHQRAIDELTDTFASNIEGALMDLVSGSKSVEDAFKSMMRSILLDIYNQMVAKPIASMASNFIIGLFSANGNAFVNGNVQAFANGGVVDSPTMFKYSGGTGLMGEAGPEAILPLGRGPDGKLGVKVTGGGSSDAVVVNLTFNVSGNGDETILNILKQQYPVIAQQVKRAIIDAKARGERGL